MHRNALYPDTFSSTSFPSNDPLTEQVNRRFEDSVTIDLPLVRIDEPVLDDAILLVHHINEGGCVVKWRPLKKGNMKRGSSHESSKQYLLTDQRVIGKDNILKTVSALLQRGCDPQRINFVLEMRCLLLQQWNDQRCNVT